MNKIIYFLSDYNWQRGELLESSSNNNYKIHVPESFGYLAQTKMVSKEKCAFPGEKVCVVWECWKGKNGRGAYRVERELYPAIRISADSVNYGSSGPGRVTESEYGIEG